MKLVHKLIAVSALAGGTLVGPAAFAQIHLPATTDGSGVVVSVWDTTRNVSLIQYLGFDEQQAGSLAAGTDFALSNFSSVFAGSSTSNLVFTVEGAFTGTATTTSFVTTGPTSGLGSVIGSNVVTANTQIGNILQQFNIACSSATFCVSDATQSPALNPGVFAGGTNFGVNVGGALTSVSAAGTIGGNPLAWYLARRNGVSTGTPAVVTQIGTALWSLTSDGVLHYGTGNVVPLPAAVWLLLSGLAGVVTVGRRKVAA
jgi:hypothetical protein